MRNNLPAVVSALATFILLACTGYLLFVAQIVALNGVIDQSKAFMSIGIGAICQAIAVLLASAFAGWFANTLIMKFDWQRATAVIASVLVGTLLGAAMGIISIAISIPMAGIH